MGRDRETAIFGRCLIEPRVRKVRHASGCALTLPASGDRRFEICNVGVDVSPPPVCLPRVCRPRASFFLGQRVGWLALTRQLSLPTATIARVVEFEVAKG